MGAIRSGNAGRYLNVRNCGDDREVGRGPGSASGATAPARRLLLGRVRRDQVPGSLRDHEELTVRTGVTRRDVLLLAGELEPRARTQLLCRPAFRRQCECAGHDHHVMVGAVAVQRRREASGELDERGVRSLGRVSYDRRYLRRRVGDIDPLQLPGGHEVGLRWGCG